MSSAAFATPDAPAERLWRDQWVFLGDDGEVVALVLQRRSTGVAEAKGWIGVDGKWRGHTYETFEISAAEFADAAVSLSAWVRESRQVRAALDRDGGGLSLSVRAPSFSVRLSAESLVALGEIKDPEGVTRYEAGRARFTFGRRERPGLVVVERTPEEHPCRAHVEYGDFTFVVARVGPRLIVAKRSDRRPEFNQALVVETELWAGQKPVRVATGGEAVHVVDPDGTSATLRALDRSASAGVAPDGRSRRHEVWLLGGDGVGVAFRIMPVAGR